MKTTVKGVHASMLPYNLDSTVRMNTKSWKSCSQPPGCAVIIARSFARIHETNLKKQGVLPLWFADKADYSRIGSGDVVETLGLADLFAGKDTSVKVRVTKRNGETFDINTRHTLSGDQLKWLQAGSALNHIRSQMASVA